MVDILIADDEQNWRELAEEIFLIAGYTCDFAIDWEQAITKLEEQEYRIICINWKLKDYNHGKALVRRLNLYHPHIPVILTTGYPMFTAGSWDDASKKFDQKIENLLSRYSNLKKIIIKGTSEIEGREFIDILLDEVQNRIGYKQEEEISTSFDVFLCHNSEDKASVKSIGEELRRRGIKPWLDEWELRPGLSWQIAVEEQIENIKTAAVFVGQNGIGPWQNQEIRSLLTQFTRRGCPVIPVILNDASKKPKLPLFLQEMTWVDFRRDKPNPMEQLEWGITGKKK